MEWLKKLGAAIDYIENNLDKEISYDEAARIACCSPCYFQRIFSYVSGVSLSEYIRRRKMTQAAFELQRTEAKVIDIALKYGYSSPTSFNRAFQNVHGITPAAAKSMGSMLQAYPSIQFKVELTGGSGIAYHIAERQPLHIVGIRIPLVWDMEVNLRIVPDFWKGVLQGNQFLEICKLSNQEPNGILGISVYESPKEIYYYIGVATTVSAPAGMYEYEIPAATWVIFESDGRFQEDVQRVFRRFCTEWLPFSGYQYAKLPDIEVYPVCDSRAAHGHSKVWIAIK
ncbi:MAG: AraC family transcriptional regulator [Lachnospiraceae bacterium]|jgi:AraC family transcriptional regulator|nr:AraC family transcriptional regulator [Lachnospiraceae bacterium]